MKWHKFVLCMCLQLQVLIWYSYFSEQFFNSAYVIKLLFYGSDVFHSCLFTATAISIKISATWGIRIWLFFNSCKTNVSRIVTVYCNKKHCPMTKRVKSWYLLYLIVSHETPSWVMVVVVLKNTPKKLVLTLLQLRVASITSGIT